MDSIRLAKCLFAVTILAVGACVYRVDISQGNLLDEEAIAQVDVGMSRSAVQFLLGTPMVADSFHEDRWDYAYYYREGRSREIDQAWIAIHFDDQDRVIAIERDLDLDPTLR